MFNILIYKKAQGDFSIGIPCLNDTNQCHPGWNGYLDKYDLFNFVGLKKQVGLRKKIPNTKYIVFISYYGHFISNTDFKPLYDCQLGYNYAATVDTRRSEFYMPDRVRTDSENGLVHWVIDYNTECIQLDQTDYANQIDFNRVCQLLHTVPNNITLITGGETVSELGTATLASPDNLGYNCITGHELYNFINIRKGNPNDEVHNTYSSQKIRNIINGENLKYIENLANFTRYKEYADLRIWQFSPFLLKGTSDVFFHFASQTSLQNSRDDVLNDLKTNVVGFACLKILAVLANLRSSALPDRIE